jgi:NADH-quinone oxidoreductase subunit J/NAD(P)H-quinone oxidoreductase subunit 6
VLFREREDRSGARTARRTGPVDVTAADVLLVALGAVAVGAAGLVVTTRQLVHAGLWLVVSLSAVAGLYLVLTAELVAWVQVLIYVGAVVVLLLFAVMLTRAPIGASADMDRPRWAAVCVGGGAGTGLAALLATAYRWTRVPLPATGTAERLGTDLFGIWVLPFEVLSVLLLAALIGAIVISRPDIGAAPGAPPNTAPGAPPNTAPGASAGADPGTRPGAASSSRPSDGGR